MALDTSLAEYLNAARAAKKTNSIPVAQHPMVHGCRAILAPHAGYRFSGRAAASAYGCIDPDTVDRVFVLGPSHRAYLEGCALSPFSYLATPLGLLPVDTQAIEELHASNMFTLMSADVDQAEHSIEMHLPYIYKVWSGRPVRVVPVLVGQLSTDACREYAMCLAEYLADPRTLFVISTDFCHWGARFRYTRYQAPQDKPVMLSTQTKSHVRDCFPIYKSIAALDEECMAAISFDSQGAARARAEYLECLRRTQNTICGRYPIMLLLTTLELLEEAGFAFECRFTHYEQSSACETLDDSSVSYASAYVRSLSQSGLDASRFT